MPDFELVRGRLQFSTFDKRGSATICYSIYDHEGLCESKTMVFPPYPNLIHEKVALLDLTGQGKRVPGVGKKQSVLVYYLHFSPEELTHMESEYDRHYASGGLDASEPASEAGASILGG